MHVTQACSMSTYGFMPCSSHWLLLTHLADQCLQSLRLRSHP